MPSFEVLRADDGLVVRLAGEIDVADDQALRVVFDEAVRESPPRIIVDLRDLSFIDSAGLRVLVWAQRQALSEGAVFAIVCPPGRVREVFRMTGLLEVLPVVDTVEAAWAAPQDLPR